ncbi:uncharacterized protein BP5553_05853 [Venustampulla echinocandica]|uniref:Gem-associated protein 5 TPR domain-containing protein n=1 Tax=Venustampulla echinocandica TaxID=2656787 RepID=A0A370TLU6_9HELO|nr:uncharacterized protein BP5553_05853 [Venustampulla echinocandica]RDL36501.1 hypothetical protein BP5553_05853 [Venustampulla echinocandica]
MSSGKLSRHRSVSMSSGHSSKGRMATLAEISQSMPAEYTREFEPCAATASMFLYAQGNSVVCAHHDTLTIERRFSRHTEEISILAVDTVSDRGAGRLVVSYDVGQTAIVWDCMTGDEIARFASYENLTVAAWMRNGNVAFGNSQGNVILFEPSTSEHISARTIDQIPITALAPAADCRTYAIGFSNGSLLIAALQPRFTILHNLSTSRGPSPIVTLAWHASSSRQKSDMLATQTHDGDLRVWSIAKSPTSTDTAKVVRVLKRTENFQPGPNWLAWSKNGRIIQFSEGETSSWDVRTKHVTYDPVATLEHVRGLAVYGPGATLFTLGPNNTAQQFDLNIPAQLVANVQHPANLLPPSPPVSIEEQKKQNSSSSAATGPVSAVPINIDISESDEDHMSPLARIAREMDKIEQGRQIPDREDTLSPVSSRSRASTTSRSSAGSRVPRQTRKHASVASRGISESATTMSLGSSLHSTREPSVVSSRDSLSMSSIGSSHASRRSKPRGSRLRQEVLQSPEEAKLVDLFKFTKSRLSDIPYSHPQVLDNTHLTNNDLRRQMLSTIFGWPGEADALIEDEMSRHPAGSPNRLLLAKWLGDIDTDIMATSSESMTSSDWMLLALSGIGGTASQAKVARAYVQRLLEKGDVHTAATILIGMGDQNDAIEIYVSHKKYMEALVLTCLVFPSDWQRQAELVRKWGEWAVQHSQQQLAIRCFSCTGSESSEPWFSPTAQAATFSQLQGQSIPELLSPPLSPPGARGPQRSIAKTSALKLITSFGDKSGKSKFFGVGEDERTPVGGGVTPIAESALSPSGGDAATAFLRPSHRSVYNTPASARTATPGGFSRQRLPSIGEAPGDVLPRRKLEPATLPTPVDSGSDREKNERLARAHERAPSQPEVMQLSSATYNPTGRAATASPMMEKTKAKRPSNPLPSPSPESFTKMNQAARTRNGSRDRKPDGLQIQWPPMESIITGDYMTSPDVSVASSRLGPSSRSIAGSAASLSTAGRSPLVSERSYKSVGAASPIVTGRSLDQYISSLDSAQYHAEKQRTEKHRTRHSSRERQARARSSSRKAKAREPSEDRGRSAARYIKPAKRSPTSPVPMSPEDLIDLGAHRYKDAHEEPRKVRETSRSRVKSSRTSSRVRQASPESVSHVQTSTKPTSRMTSRNNSRRTSPAGRIMMIDTRARGRSQAREGSTIRSPSSPLPMSPQAKFYRDEDDAEDLKRAYEDQMRFRSRHRSTSRLRERAQSAARDGSPERKRRDRSSSRRPSERDNSRTRRDPSAPRRERREQSHARSVSGMEAGDLNAVKDARTLKKEQAARELEERRKSLARRPSAPPIVHPEEIASLSPVTYRQASPDLTRASLRQVQMQPSRSQTTSPANIQTSPAYLKESTTSSPQVGLPATPRAMRHPKYDPDGKDIPDVPQIPEKYDAPQAPSWGSLNAISYNNAFETLGPLPKTTYSAVPRRIPPRSASAPIPEEQDYTLPAAMPTHPAFQSALPPSSRRRTQEPSYNRGPIASPRKVNPGESQPGTLGYETRNNNPVYSTNAMGGIDETIEASSQPVNPSNDSLTPPPPPPPPAPPILKELQHLAMPPPPPPAPIAPLYRSNDPTRPNDPNTNSVVSGVSQGSAVIEIVMDDDDNKSKSPTTEALTPPQPLFAQGHSRKSSQGHNRGRSENDNSISGRFSRAAERLRSASRGRNGNFERTKSPPIEHVGHSPYESVPPPNWGPTRSTPNLPVGSPPMSVERHPREVKAAMQEMEGGMI